MIIMYNYYRSQMLMSRMALRNDGDIKVACVKASDNNFT